MKKIFLVCFVLILGVIAGTMSGCKKDKKDETQAPEYKKPTLATNGQVVTIPAKLQSSTNSNAQTALGYLMTVNAMSSYVSYFTPPANAVHTNSKSTMADTYTWSYTQMGQDGINYTFTYTYTFTQTSDKYFWDIKLGINGSVPSNFIIAEEKIDGTYGKMSIYYGAFSGIAGTDISTYYYTYEWTKASNGTLTVDMEWHNGTSSLMKYRVIVNTDGSGEVIYYNLNGTMAFKLTWTANGTGNYYWYDENGVVTTSGTWS